MGTPVPLVSSPVQLNYPASFLKKYEDADYTCIYGIDVVWGVETLDPRNADLTGGLRECTTATASFEQV